MAYCRLVLSLLVISAVQCLSITQVPVFLWGDLGKSTLKSTPLTPVSNLEFNDLLVELFQTNPYVVVFDEETLSVEDFSLKNDNGGTSFPYLHNNIGKALYLPSVSSPLQAVEDIVEPEKTDYIKITEKGVTVESIPENARVLFVSLKDAQDGESRADLLRRHNDIMQDLFAKLQEKYGSVVGIYTASNPSWTVSESHLRTRRATNDTSNNKQQYALDNLLISFTTIDLFVDGNKVDLPASSSHSSNLNETELNATLNFGDNQLTLNFYSQAGYWFFESVTLTETSPSSLSEVLYPTSQLYVINGFSYTCGEGLTFMSINETKSANVTFVNVQLEPFFAATNKSDMVFSEALDCVGYFSVPIWSGLFVVFVMLFITFSGIMMMLDIRTNDRYDDPKGKTITINAGE